MLSPIWDKFKRANEIKNYTSNAVEIGYSQYGMTVGISGTMTSTGKFTIIMSMNVDLFNKKDRHMFVFDWLAFRPIQFTDTGFKAADIKMASKFLVTDTEPYKYNIVFADQVQYSTINPIFKQIRSEWEKVLKDNLKSPAPQEMPELFKHFLQRQTIIAAEQTLREKCYWAPEVYTIRLTMLGKNNTKVYEEEKHFTITDDDMKKLEANPVAIIADVCQQPAVPYTFLKVPLR